MNKLKVLELFSGTQSISKTFRKRGLVTHKEKYLNNQIDAMLKDYLELDILNTHWLNRTS